MGKRKAKIDDEELESEDVDVEEEKPKKKRAPRAPKVSEPMIDELGFHIEPPSIIWKDYGSEPGEKIAGFDLDGTLVNTKMGGRFARHAGDWKWWNKKVPAKLKEYAEDGFKIVIFTNQGSIKSALLGPAAKTVKQKVDLIAKALQQEGVQVQVFIAPAMAEGDPARKPATGMWSFMVEHCNGGVTPDTSSSFFVGDADGSGAAHSDSDKKFAEALGVEFKLPEPVFGKMEGKAALANEDVKAAMADVESGTHPNAELIKQFKEAADEMFVAVKEAGEPIYKATSLKKAGDALATFRTKITLANLKEVGKLQNVGKSTLEKIKNYLNTGSIKGEQGAAAAAEKAAAQKAQEAKVSKATEAAMKFM